LIKPPIISIVTPSFNQGQFLEECIDSILSQNYPNLEYVIMDGGSTDNSVEIIRKYERYLTYWQSKPDKGQYDAINEGFKKTTGEIMAWLNSDDKYHHHAFFKVAYLFGKHRDMEWVTGRPTIWEKDGGMEYVLSEFLPAFSRERYLKKDFKSTFIQQESTFWRRSLWEKAGGMIRTDLNYAGDLELWVRFFRSAQLFTADTLLAGYRKHGNQKAVLAMDKYIEEAEKILDEENELFNKGIYKDLLPAPAPVSVPHGEVKAYIDNIYSETRHSPYKISDDSDLVVDSLIKILSESEADRAARLKVIHSYQQQLDETGKEFHETKQRLEHQLHETQASLFVREQELQGTREQLHETQANLLVTEQELQGTRQQLDASEADRAARLEVIYNQQHTIEVLSNPETAIATTIVIVLKKVHLYNFYMRHQSFFGRMYRNFRGLFTSQRMTDPAISTTANAVDKAATSPLDSPQVEAFVAARALPGDTDDEALVRLYDMGSGLTHVLCLNPWPGNVQALFVLSKVGSKVTCLACGDDEAELQSYGFITSRAGLAEWMVLNGITTLSDFDGLFLDPGVEESTLSLLKGRLWSNTRVFVNGSPRDQHPLWAEWDDHKRTVNGIDVYDSPPETWLDPLRQGPDFYHQSHWPWKTRDVEVPAALPSGRPWPKISVVTVTLNQGAYLEQTLRSVLLQGYPNLEYIVIDGGSTDNTPTILKRYREELAQCVTGKDKGQADALNKGFRLATGDIMTWLNSDDYYQPWTLWRVAIAFDTYGADIVAGGCALVKGDVNRPFRIHHNAMPFGRVVPLPLDRLLDIDGSWQKGDFFYQPEVFFSRDIWERSGSRVDEDLYYSMDYELWVRLAMNGGRIVHIPDTLTFFRYHESQKTSGEELPFLPELRQVNARLRKALKRS
jgi:glycosyltransferase involved in cell wall biosynthesis